MTSLQPLTALTLVVPVLAAVCLPLVERGREPWHGRPMTDSGGSGGG